LIIGTVIYFKSDLLTTRPNPINTIFPPDSSAGYSAAIILLFFGVSHFLGLLLGSLSFTIERLWRGFAPLDMDGLKKFLGTTDGTELESRFNTSFGQKLQDKSLNEASFLCSFFVWGADPNLGIMTARDDAEALSSRSLALVSLVLFVLPFFECLIAPAHAAPTLVWSLCSGVIVIGSFLYFNYLRKKRLFGRFALFIAATSVKATSAAKVIQKNEQNQS
jgi:hypothetical protein